MRQPTRIAKIARPKFFGIYPRKRLFLLLDKARKQPVVWVKGPPGAGKTALASSYLEDRNLPCLWYRLDEGDNDVGSFFYFMGLAAKRAAPRRRKPLPVLTPEYLPGLSTFSRNYFLELFSRLPTPFVLVFDNYHEILPESLLHEVVRCGLEEVCEGINIVLTSRKGPPPKLATLRSRRMMATLGWDALRLTPEESHGIVALHSQERISKDTVQTIHKRAGGWVAGLVLLIEGTSVRVAESGTFPGKTPAVVFDYLAGEFFDKMDVQSRDFLLETSFLPRMTARMAQEMTGIGQAKSVLSHLNRHHYFIDKSADPEPFYQYHALFQEFLQSRALDTYTFERLDGIRLKGARVLEDFGQMEEAVTLYSKAECWDRVAGLIIKQAPLLISQGRSLTLQGWLDRLPDDLVNQNPWLLYWIGVCRLPFEPSQSRSHFDGAFRHFKERKDPTGIFLSWCGVVNAILFEFDDFGKMDPWLALLDELITLYPVFPSREIEARVVFSMFLSLSYRQPAHQEMHTWAERVLRLCRESSDVNFQIEAGFHLIFHEMFRNPSKAAVLLQEFQELARSSQNVSPLTQLRMKTIEAIYYDWVAGNPDECLDAVCEGLEVSRKTGVHVLDYLLWGNGAAGSLTAGDFEQARGFLSKMAQLLLGRGSRFELSFYEYMASWEALLRGDILIARQHSKMGLKLCEELGGPFQKLISQVLAAQVFHEQRQDRDATELLSQAHRASHRMGNHSMEWMCLLAKAQFILDRGDERSGLRLLRKALTLGREKGFVNGWGWRSDVMARLCVTALEHKIEVEYVQDLIRKRNLNPDNPPVDVEEWPWAVKVYTMGRFDLVVDGRSIRFSKKTPKRPLMLLKAVIAFGGHNVGVEQICDALWSDADGDSAQAALNMTLSRLRKLVRHEKAITYREGRVSLNPRYCWIDTWALELILDRFDPSSTFREKGIQDAGPAHKLFLTEKAMGLYKGDFLRTDPDYH